VHKVIQVLLQERQELKGLKAHKVIQVIQELKGLKVHLDLQGLKGLKELTQDPQVLRGLKVL
jgi:hypothetical protein